MSQSDGLSIRREGTVINVESKEQEKDLNSVTEDVLFRLKEKFSNLTFIHEKRAMLKDIIENNVFDYEVEKSIKKESFLSPDGGFLYIKSVEGKKYPILISEVKKQGTNGHRMAAGMPKQAKGNAIERLGKNVLGFKVILKNESIFPFICFCYGNDFEEGSSIRDRVATIASFAKLNTIHVNDSPSGTKIGSYFLREEYWSFDEMLNESLVVAEKAIDYYIKKYGYNFFSNK